MPKRIFRFRISSIALERKLFSKSFKSRFNCKTSEKFVWIDGSLKRNWRELKLKSGYKTDRLFLCYLLDLAKRDLFSNRINEKNIEDEDDEANSKNGMLSISYENSSNQSWRKSFNQDLEKEKRMRVYSLQEEEKKKMYETDINVKTAIQKTETVKNANVIDVKIKTNSEAVCSLGNGDKVLNKSSSQNINKSNFEIIHDKENQVSGKIKNHGKNCDGNLGKNSNRLRKNRKAKQLHKDGSGVKEKGDFCSKCNLKHSGKCLLDDYKSNEIQNKTEGSDDNSSQVLNDESMNENIYIFKDSEREECINGDIKNYISDTQKLDISDKNLNFLLNKNYKNDSISNIEGISFAKTTLPEYLYLKIINEDHGLSVFTKIFLKKLTQFGPLIGDRVKEMDIGDEVNMRDIWEIHLKENTCYISTQDVETSNWLRYVRPADNKESANLLTVVKNGSLYFDAIKDIQIEEELVYWISETNLLWSKKKLEKKNCGGCNIQFTHTLYYRKHCMIFHDPNISLTTRKYHCKICGLAVLGKEKIIKHAAEMHHGKGAYQCQYCQKFFLRLNYLEMHRTYGCAENPQRSRPLCDLCGRKFCQPQKLKAHIKRMHSDMAVVLRDFQCKNCQKILGSRAALQRHLKEVHNKGVVGAFTCDRCGKIFQNKSNLKIHMLTHSGVKPFKCQEVDCSAAFTTKQCLKFHYKKVHGFSDDVIPKIERSVAYTFDAYSGGVVSDPDQDSTIQLEGSQYSIIQEKNEGIDLTLGIQTQDSSVGKRSAFSPLLPEDSNLIIHLDDKYMYTKNTKDVSRKESEAKSPNARVISDEEDIYTQPNLNKTKLNKTKEKKLWGVSEKIDLNQPVFKENSNTSLLVEAAINAAEKDLIEKSPQGNCKSVVCTADDEVMESQSEIYSFNHYDSNPSEMMCESSFKKPQMYDKPSLDCPKINCFQDTEYKANFLLKEKSNFGEMLKFNSLLRINTSPFSEVQKDCNLLISVRDQDGESLPEDEMEGGRGKDLAEITKGQSPLNVEGFRTHDSIRTEKYNACRSIECDLRLASGMKFEYGDVDFSNEYRSLEKNRGIDLGLHKGCEGYERIEVDKEGGAENLCLKEKYQCDNLDELTKLGRESSGFDGVFASDTAAATSQNQTFGGLFRSPHGIVSPRSYHPAAFESESVDLSVRPAFSSSSPIYTLDLTPSRVELPARHLDFRTHLGLPPLRFGSSTSAMSNGDPPQIPSPGYGIYQSSYGVSAHRPCQTPQFQPYAPLYY